MSGYLQVAAGVLLAVIMVLALGKDGKQTAILLVIAVCGMVGILTMGYLEPVVAFIRRLGTVGKVNTQMIGILLKVVGIGFIVPFTTSVSPLVIPPSMPPALFV